MALTLKRPYDPGPVGIPKGSVIACDTETTGINVWLGDRPFCFTFCNEKGETGYYYWKVNPFTREVVRNKKEWRKMKAFFEDDTITKVFHNAKFDIHMLNSIGIKVKGRIEDTMVAHYCLKSNSKLLGLKPMAKHYLKFPDSDEKELKDAARRARLQGKKLGYKIADKKLHGKNPTVADYWLCPQNLVLKYAIGDVQRTIRLWQMFDAVFEDDKYCFDTYRLRLKCLHGVVMDMERTGTRVRLNVVREEIKNHTAIMEKNLRILRRKLNWPKFNPKSPKHLCELVYNRLKFPITEYTDKGNPRVGSKTLGRFKHKLLKRIVLYQSSQKAISSFYANFLLHAVKDSEGHWIIHPWYSLTSTTTGRFGCSNPNLQNVADENTTQALVPIQARRPFCPRKGRVWLSIDYSGEELWIYVNNSGEPVMLKELRAGRNVHLKTAREVWPEEQARDEKSGAKTVYKRGKILGFSMIFGAGPKSISEYHGIPYAEAKRIYDTYHGVYPGIKRYIGDRTREIEEQGYILNPYNRKIWMDPEWGYRSGNYSVQGTAADVMIKVMVKLYKYFRKNNLDVKIVLTIHDELIFEIPKSILSRKLVEEIMFIMSDQPELKLIGGKLPVSCSLIEKTWANKSEIKDLKELDHVRNRYKEELAA